MLTVKQEQLMLELLQGTSLTESARKCGISLRTASRWNSSAEFAEEMERRKSEMTKQAYSRLKAMQTAALDTLNELMTNGEVSDTARLGAARTVLDSYLRFAEVEELRDGIADLKTQMTANGED